MNTLYPWNAVYTHANCEKKVSRLLEKKKIVHYFPQNRVAAEQDQKFVATALFPSIIFIQVQDNQQLASLASLSNVTNLVYWQQNPAVFPAAEINLLRNFLETHETVQAVKTPLQVAQSGVRPLVNHHTFSADNIHTINLPSIGYSLSAKAEPVTNIKLVRKTATVYNAADSLAFILGFKTNNSKI